MAITASELKTLKTFKEFRVKKGDSIDFKSSPFYQEGSLYVSSLEKSYESTKKFLNKITDGKSQVGVALNRLDKNNVELTIGAKKTFDTGVYGGPAYTPGSTYSTPMGNVTTPGHYNPTAYGYQSYSSDRTTFFKSILDNSLNKTSLIGTDSAFDQIKKYEKDSTIARTIFKIGDDFILGFYNQINKTYKLVRFR